MVTIETKGKPTKEFFGEYQALRLRYKKLLKNPCMKLRSAVTNVISLNIVFLILTVFYIIYSYQTKVTFILAGTVLLAFITCFYTLFSIAILKEKKKFLSDYTKRIITIDENGISLNSDKQNVLVKWNSIKYIVINKHTVCVMPEKAGNLMLAFSTDYKDDIIRGVAEYSHSDLIIDNSFLYR